jgi:[ribosomal protein S5]-alanine N-acetyltransferase
VPRSGRGPLFTKRLRLRPPTSADIPSVEKMRRDPRVIAFFPRAIKRFERRSALRKTRRAIREGKAYPYVIREGQSGLFVGTTSLFKIDWEEHSAELGYILAPQSWGKGYATEAAHRMCQLAFRRLRLHRLDATVLEGNGASVAVLRKLGFRPEGSSRKAVRVRGRWRDCLRFGLLASEFRDS